MKRLAVPIALLVVVAAVGCVNKRLGVYGDYIEGEIRFRGLVKGLVILRTADADGKVRLNDEAYAITKPIVNRGNEILKDIHAQIDATPPGETPQVSVNLTEELLILTEDLLVVYERNK